MIWAILSFAFVLFVLGVMLACLIVGDDDDE